MSIVIFVQILLQNYNKYLIYARVSTKKSAEALFLR